VVFAFRSVIRTLDLVDGIERDGEDSRPGGEHGGVGAGGDEGEAVEDLEVFGVGFVPVEAGPCRGGRGVEGYGYGVGERRGGRGRRWDGGGR